RYLQPVVYPVLPADGGATLPREQPLPDPARSPVGAGPAVEPGPAGRAGGVGGGGREDAGQGPGAALSEAHRGGAGAGTVRQGRGEAGAGWGSPGWGWRDGEGHPAGAAEAGGSVVCLAGDGDGRRFDRRRGPEASGC